MVELITDLKIRHLVAESASRSPDLLGLYGVAAGVLEDVEKKAFPSFCFTIATSRGLAWLLVHMVRA